MSAVHTIAIFLLGWTLAHQAPAQSTGTIEIDFAEEETNQPIVCRVMVLSADGKPRRARGSLFQDGWNLVEGPLTFQGRVGDYTFRAFHGPQFSSATGGFTLDRKSSATDSVTMPRHARIDQENWFGGDLMAHVAAPATRRWLAAEDLDMAVVVSTSSVADDSKNDPDSQLQSQSASEANRDAVRHWVEDGAYHDNRAGSGLILHHWLPPADVPMHIPSARLLTMSRQESRAQALPVHAEIQRMWARDVPVWLASGLVDSIQVLSDHLSWDGQSKLDFQPFIDPEPGRFRGDRRAGRLVEYLYWQVLEAGLRIPPSAGSGFGKSSAPLGYNRVYVASHDQTPEGWWTALRAGQSFVTSGPLLRATVNGHWPGRVFEANAGDAIELDIALTLTVSDPVEYLDVIFNGNTLYQARLDEYAAQGGRIPPLSITDSGWLVIRVVTERDFSYRIASTAPYYFEFDGNSRISAQSVQLFLKWLQRAHAEIATLDDATRAAATPYLEAAEKFWKARLSAANVP